MRLKVQRKHGQDNHLKGRYLRRRDNNKRHKQKCHQNIHLMKTESAALERAAV
jgi:hypothetical protein